MCWMSECSFDLIPQNRHGGYSAENGVWIYASTLYNPLFMLLQFHKSSIWSRFHSSSPHFKICFEIFSALKLSLKFHQISVPKASNLTDTQKVSSIRQTFGPVCPLTKLLFSALCVAHSYQNERTDTSWQAVKVDSSHDWFITRTGHISGVINQSCDQFYPDIRHPYLRLSWIWN